MNEGSNIFVISGPSGCGKNTVYEGLVKKSSLITQTVSATTRAPRKGENEGIDYYFIPPEEFTDKISAGDFVEYVKYGSNYYGTLKSEIKRLTDAGKIIILIVEVNGAASIKKQFPGATTVFLLPPSMEVLKKRITARGTNSEEEISTRLAIAAEELKLQTTYDFRVVNDVLETCIDEVYEIILNKIGGTEK